MKKQQEEKLTNQIRLELTKIRNDAIVTGMRSALSVVLDMCNKEASVDDKLNEIKEFCEKGLNNR